MHITIFFQVPVGGGVGEAGFDAQRSARILHCTGQHFGGHGAALVLIQSLAWFAVIISCLGVY